MEHRAKVLSDASATGPVADRANDTVPTTGAGRAWARVVTRAIAATERPRVATA
jgi:hypothetical protein